ncbi:MAG: hypothetical protein NVSMB67_12510 [Flavisolibacter sp.]
MEPQSKNSDEIDILYFFNPIIKGFKGMGRSTNTYFQNLKKNFLLFLLSFLFLAALGYSFRFIFPGYYKTKAIFITKVMPLKLCSEMFININTLVSEGKNENIIADQMKMSVVAARAIKKIYTGREDSLVNYDHNDSGYKSFELILVVNDKSKISEIQEGILNFLQNNGYAKRHLEARKKTLQDLSFDLVTRIKNMDSLKDILSRSVVPRSSGQGIILGEPVSPISAYEVQLKYFKLLSDYRQELSLLQNFEVVQPFLQIQNPNYPNMNKIFIYWIILILAGLLIAVPFFGKSSSVV